MSLAVELTMHSLCRTELLYHVCTTSADLNLSFDWLTESIDLHTPDSEDGDVIFTPSPSPYTSLTDVTLPLTPSPTPYTSLTDVTLPLTPSPSPYTSLTDVTLPLTPTPYTSLTDVTLPLTPSPTPYTSLTDVPLTPGSSHPPTPLSTSPSSEVDDLFSLFSNQNSNDSSDFLSSDYLPFGLDSLQFDSSPDSSPNSSHFNSPALTPINSPYPSFYTPQEYTTPPLETPVVLVEETSIDASQSRKRKASKLSERSSSKPKRRTSITAKKERKREQNKTAALRYRQKKKEEKNGSFSQVDDLEAKNAELKKTLSTMTAEIKYLQKLWAEVSTAQQKKLEQSLPGIC